MAEHSIRVGPVELGTSTAANADRLTVKRDDATTYNTVPSTSPDTVAYIKGVRVVNTSGADKKITWGIGVDASGTRLTDQAVVPAHGVWSESFEGPGLPLFEGDDFRAHADGATSLTLTAWGYETS